MFEATHGTAPRLAGTDRANPVGVILSAAMLLRHVGERDAGDRLEAAVADVLADGRGRDRRPPRPGRRRPAAGTRRMAEAVAARLRGAVDSMARHPIRGAEASMKITVVGSGFVGQTAAMRLLEKGLGEVCLIDIIEGKPQGLALDLKEAAPVEGYEPTIVGTNDYADTAGSDIVVITAGFPRQPGMSRMDLLGKNAAIMRDVIDKVVPGSPDAILIVVSNPLDEMTFLAAEASGFPKRARHRDGRRAGLGPAALLHRRGARRSRRPRRGDDARLARRRDGGAAAPRDRQRDAAARARGRGDAGAAVPADPRRRRRDRGAAEGGSAYYAPSASVVAMVEAIVRDTKAVLPVCAWTTGQYGIYDVYVGVPARLGRAGSRRSSSST